MVTKIKAAMADADMATQAELDTETAARIAATIGGVAQIVYTQTGAVATGSTVIPLDDTIPQITEGDEFMTVTITPKAGANLLRIDVTAYLASGAGSFDLVGALFRDASANAIGAICQTGSAANSKAPLRMTVFVNAASTLATTFRFRAGIAGGGTTTFNGQSGARQFGGVAASTMVVTEIRA